MGDWDISGDQGRQSQGKYVRGERSGNVISDRGRHKPEVIVLFESAGRHNPSREGATDRQIGNVTTAQTENGDMSRLDECGAMPDEPKLKEFPKQTSSKDPRDPAVTKVPWRIRFSLCYFNFVLGALLSMPVLPTKQILMDDLKVGPATMAAVLSWTTLPWSIKPVYGFISDSYPILGYRRKPYIVLGLLANAGSWLFLGFASQAHFGLASVSNILFLASISLVVAQVGCDTLVVEYTKLECGDDMGSLQSGVWTSQAVGSCLAAIFSGVALDHPKELNAQTILSICALAALSGLLSVVFVHEARHKAPEGGAHGLAYSFGQISEFWRRPEIWRTSLFVTLFASSPTAGDALFYFFRYRLHFSMGFLGVLDVVGYAASAVGALWFQRSLKRLGYTSLLRGTIWCAFFLGITTIFVVLHWNRAMHIPDHAFVFGDTVALAVCAQVAWMPIAIIAARVAPDGAEGTVYQTVISVWNLCSIVSQFSGGLITRALGVTSDSFTNLWLLVLVCNLTTLTPLPFLYLIPSMAELEMAPGGAVGGAGGGGAGVAGSGGAKAPLAALPVSVVDAWEPTKLKDEDEVDDGEGSRRSGAHGDDLGGGSMGGMGGGGTPPRPHKDTQPAGTTLLGGANKHRIRSRRNRGDGSSSGGGIMGHEGAIVDIDRDVSLPLPAVLGSGG
eukprot:jgi/Mesvir1/24292/Mv10988-RA.1